MYMTQIKIVIYHFWWYGGYQQWKELPFFVLCKFIYLLYCDSYLFLFVLLALSWSHPLRTTCTYVTRLVLLVLSALNLRMNITFRTFHWSCTAMNTLPPFSLYLLWVFILLYFSFEVNKSLSSCTKKIVFCLFQL